MNNDDQGDIEVEFEPIENRHHKPDVVLQKCPKCGYEATSTQDPLLSAHNGLGECPQCGIIVKKYLLNTAQNNTKGEHISSTERNMEDIHLANSIKGWSWGAFLLTPLWSFFNKTWIGLLSLIPYLGILVSFYLGFKGRELAWKNKEWSSVEHFIAVQDKWSRWAVRIVMIMLVVGVSAALIIPRILQSDKEMVEDHSDIIVSAFMAASNGDYSEADRFLESSDSLQQNMMKGIFGDSTNYKIVTVWDKLLNGRTISDIKTSMTAYGKEGTYQFFDVSITYDDGSVGTINNMKVMKTDDGWKMTFLSFDMSRLPGDAVFVKNNDIPDNTHEKKIGLIEKAKQQNKRVRMRQQKMQLFFEAEEQCNTTGDEEACNLFRSLMESQ